MEYIVNALNWFVGLGSTVMVPIVILILGLCFRAGFAKSLRGGITVGVGLTGLFMVVDMIVGALLPATSAIAERFGIQLTLVDVGWADCGLGWSWPGVAPLVIAILLVNVIMLVLKLTKTMWTDVWSTWHGGVIASFVWAMSGNMIYAVIAGVIFLVLGSWCSDITAKKFQEFNGMPGVGVPCTISWAGVFAIPFAALLNKIPVVKDIDASPEAIRDKFGMFGEMAVIGFLLGSIIALFAGYPIGKILLLGVQVATMMIVLPRMVSIISEGLIPVTMAVADFVAERFEGRELHVGVDCAILLGHPSVMASAVILYPLAILLAALLPGNNMLPVASLAVIPFWCGAIAPYTKGNVLHTVIICLLWFVPFLWFGTNLAPAHTEIYKQMGLFTDVIEKGNMIASWDTGGDPIGWIIYKAFEIFGLLN